MTNKRIPMRTCVGCHESKPKKELLRIVKTPEGDISLDNTGRMNGRGAYICGNRDCLYMAKKTKGLERSFKVPVAPEVYDKLEKEMLAFEK